MNRKFIGFLLIYFTYSLLIYMNTPINPIQQLQSLAYKLATLRETIELRSTQLDELKHEKDAIQSEMMNLMQINQLKSFKDTYGSYSLVSKWDIKITDEGILKSELRHRNFANLIEERINTTEFKSIANIILRETGEILPWSDCKKVEYISIKKTQ